MGIYIFPEPVVQDAGPRSAQWADQAHLVRVRYSDRPRDLEALAVRPNGDALLIFKRSQLTDSCVLDPGGPNDRAICRCQRDRHSAD